MKKLIIIMAFAAISKITFAQPLQKGNVIGVHAMTVTLKPGVTMEQVENFYTRVLIPAYEQAFPGAKGFLLKGDKGEHQNKLGLIWWLGTRQDRDKYFTSDGLTEAGTATLEKVKKVDDERGKLAEETNSYTDWIVQ